MQASRSFMFLALAVAPLAACSDTSGPATGDVAVYMTRGTASGSAAVAPALFSASLIQAGIPLSAVDSINVDLTSIQAFHSNDSTGVVTLPLQGEGSGIIDLLALGTVGVDSTRLARGSVPVGTYNNIRLRFSSASITLNQAVTVGQATYDAGTHELTIPSGLSSGIKVQGASFTISEGDSASVNLTFDPAMSVGTIVATGANKLMMSPVLHARTNVDDD